MMFADPQSFNRYTYVNNDPVNQVDPTGLMPMLPDASTSWSDVADGFWGTSFGGPRRENHIAEGMARHDTLLATGYDTAFGIFRGEVEVRYTPPGGGVVITRTLNNPTLEELGQSMASIAQSDQLLAQTGSSLQDLGKPLPKTIPTKEEFAKELTDHIKKVNACIEKPQAAYREAIRSHVMFGKRTHVKAGVRFAIGAGAALLFKNPIPLAVGAVAAVEVYGERTVDSIFELSEIAQTNMNARIRCGASPSPTYGEPGVKRNPLAWPGNEKTRLYKWP